MKRFRYSFMLLAVAFASVLFCSCSKDDTPRMSEEERLALKALLAHRVTLPLTAQEWSLSITLPKVVRLLHFQQSRVRS